MAKSKGTTKSGTRSAGNERSKPMTPKAGVTVKRRRYDDGGKA